MNAKDEIKKCKWARVFDGHFNIGCVGKTKKRGNGNFKKDDHNPAQWDFKYCPYCGREIELIKTKEVF